MISTSFILGSLSGACAVWTLIIIARLRRRFLPAHPLSGVVVRYEGALEGRKMRVGFELGDGRHYRMLIDRHVAQKMSDDLLIGVARIDTMKSGEESAS